MTSRAFNERRRAAQEEMAAFDALPQVLKDAVNSCNRSVHATVVLNTYLRGVPVEAILAVLNKVESPK